MITVTRHGIILTKRELDFEALGVFNPAVIYVDGNIHMFYRAAANENRSTIGYCRLSDPLTVAERYDYPVIIPEFDYESHGTEDPRIVKIDDLYYLSYSAYDGKNAFGCVALSKDRKQFHKQGIIVPKFRGDKFRSLLHCSETINIKYFQPDLGNHYVWDKNLVFFPRKIDEKIYFLHRIKPGIQIASVKEIKELNEQFWEIYLPELEKHIVMDPKYNHELSYIGNGCPPIETKQGWLLVYHGVHDTIHGYMYTACAALLDLNKPEIEIARLPYALFQPEEEWELKGQVDNVCFPTGTVLIDDELYIYYGAADERIACASVKLSELLQELLNYKTE